MKVTLETISPVHVGSGIQYQGNAEYLYFDKQATLAVIDESKILDIIGTENIQIWVDYIEGQEHKKSFLEYLQHRKPDIQAQDIARRVIPLRGRQAPYFTNTLREQIHGGIECPYLPGSSIKGAIRTAIFSSLLMRKYQSVGLRDNQLGEKHRYSGKFIIGDKQLQAELFGKNPNSDWLRMLQVGDCYFQPGSTQAAFAETLNERGGDQQYEIKNDVRQLIEYIPAERQAEFQINIPEAQKKLIKKLMPELFASTVNSLDYKWLFSTIHQHSLRLLKNEIEFFEDADLPETSEELPAMMKKTLQQAQQYPENTCILRLGFGTGYRNMTGDWVKDLVLDDDVYDDIATATRRTSRYNAMPLPKSRKVMFDGLFMGYVKLTIQNTL